MFKFARLWILGDSAGLYDSQELSWTPLWACGVTPASRVGVVVRQALEWAERHGYAVLGAASRLDTREAGIVVL